MFCWENPPFRKGPGSSVVGDLSGTGSTSRGLPQGVGALPREGMANFGVGLMYPVVHGSTNHEYNIS